MKSPYDSWILQSDKNNVQVWCISNYMKLNVSNIGVICFFSKTNWHGFDCNLSESSIIHTDCIRDNSHSDFLLFITAQPPDTILDSSQTQVGNDSVPWNSITTSEAGKLGCIQWKFVTLCHQRFFSHLDHS